jgi:hypothetical protein
MSDSMMLEQESYCLRRIPTLRQRRKKKVARRVTSGMECSDFCALKERHNAVPRLQRGKVCANHSRGFTSGYLLFAVSRRTAISKHVLT